LNAAGHAEWNADGIEKRVKLEAMYFGYMLLGFIIGAWVAAGGALALVGALGGAAIGWLLARVVKSERRITELESRLRSAGAQQPVAGTTPAAPSSAGSMSAEPTKPAAVSPVPGLAAEPADRPEPKPKPEPGPAPATPAPRPAAAAGKPAEPVRPSILQIAFGKISAWFTSGNVPVKIGVVLSFIGVAFLLKYAIDRELVHVPIEFRLLAVAAAGVVLVVLGWRLRLKMRTYALSLQGGGVGILFLTIFAALYIWQLIPHMLAFVLLVALALFTGALAVLQKARSLIFLGMVGGFLAPVLASTGQGSHVALFSYYLVLNGTILGVAWFCAWRELNLMGFLFTFVIGSVWGFRYYQPEYLASTEPFLVLHFLFYQAIAILYALRQPPGRVGLVDGTLVFGTPVIAFAMQAGLMRDSEYGLAISAAVLALFYVLTATALYRRQGTYLRILSESFIALAVAFGTLAIPLALDARWTSAAWALEGAALIWVGTRQAQHLPSLAGAALIFFSGLAFLEHGFRHHEGWPVLNGSVLGGVLISLSALFAARRLESFNPQRLGLLYRLLSWALFGWGVFWWLGTGSTEIDDRIGAPASQHVILLFLALSCGAFARLGQARDWSKARRVTLLYLPVLAAVAELYRTNAPEHLLFGLGWLAWPLAIIVQVRVLRMMDAYKESLASAWHVATLFLLAMLLMLEAWWQTGHFVAGAWNLAVATAVPGILALLVWRFRIRPGWPVPAHPISYRAASLVLVSSQVLYLAWLGCVLPGDPGPVPYVPILNPFDLAALFTVATTVLSLAVIKKDHALLKATAELGGFSYWGRLYRLLLAAAFFVITTTALVRGVHHLAGVGWQADTLTNSDLVQTSLSIYWGLLGFVGMIFGARRAQRLLWLVGAGFMGLVVIKLFLVDLGNSGTIERIISFIGVGILLLVVGYFAPAPPRKVSSPATVTGPAPEAEKGQGQL